MAANSTLIALRLYLKALGVDESLPIEKKDDRKALQKLVYLGQVAGADLGYRFSWYLMGPYCSDLADDYFALKASLAFVDEQVGRRSLHPSILRSLDSLRAAIRRPNDCELADHDWLELLASYDYLIRVSKLTPDDATEHLKAKKRHLAPFIRFAQDGRRKLELLRAPNVAGA